MVDIICTGHRGKRRGLQEQVPFPRAETARSREKPDRETLDKLRSPGYISSAEAFFNLGETYLELALRKKDSQLLQESFDSFQKAIEIDENYPSPYFGLGKVCRQTGNLDGAISCWKKAVELRPDFDIALYYLGSAYLEKNDRARALECFFQLKEKFFHKYPEEMRERIEAAIEKCPIK